MQQLKKPKILILNSNYSDAVIKKYQDLLEKANGIRCGQVFYVLLGKLDGYDDMFYTHILNLDFNAQEQCLEAIYQVMRKPNFLKWI